MNIHKLEEAGIDYQQGLNRFVDKAELYERFLLKFLEDKNYSQLIANIETSDWVEAFKHAHALKGIAGNLSLNQFYKVLSTLVEALRLEEYDQVEELKDTVQKSYEITVAAICNEK